MSEANNDNFGIGVIRLLACGLFDTAIEAIRAHRDFKERDNLCIRVIAEIDTVKRIILNSRNIASKSITAAQFVQE